MTSYPHTDLILKLHHASANMTAISRVLRVDLAVGRRTIKNAGLSPVPFSGRPAIPWQDLDSSQPIIRECQTELRRRKDKKVDELRESWRNT